MRSINFAERMLSRAAVRPIEAHVQSREDPVDRVGGACAAGARVLQAGAQGAPEFGGRAVGPDADFRVAHDRAAGDPVKIKDPRRGGAASAQCSIQPRDRRLRERTRQIVDRVRHRRIGEQVEHAPRRGSRRRWRGPGPSVDGSALRTASRIAASSSGEAVRTVFGGALMFRDQGSVISTLSDGINSDTCPDGRFSSR